MNKYIGISGVARSGKSTFAKTLVKELNKKGISAIELSLAYELKKDCQEFLMGKLGLDVFSEDTETKSKFRDMLVWYGDLKRKESKGRYWIEKIEKEVEKHTERVIIVPDIRYSFYDNDELQWIQNEKQGILVHLSIEGLDPANEHEKTFDPILREKSDVCLHWKRFNDPKGVPAETYVESFIYFLSKNNMFEVDHRSLRHTFHEAMRWPNGVISEQKNIL